MQKYLPLLVLPFLVSCGGQPEVTTEPEEQRPPVYCIRSIEETGNGTFILDMPGYPYGQDDDPIEVESDTLEFVTEHVEECSEDDPRIIGG